MLSRLKFSLSTWYLAYYITRLPHPADRAVIDQVLDESAPLTHRQVMAIARDLRAVLKTRRPKHSERIFIRLGYECMMCGGRGRFATERCPVCEGRQFIV